MIRELFIIIVFSILFLVDLSGQFHAGIGVGTGISRHADSYIEDRGFKVVQFSGYRAAIFGARIHYTLPTETSIYCTYRFSPNVTTVSPYKYTFPHFGLEQMLPGTPFYISGGYGQNEASTSISLSSGTLWLAGLGIQTEFTRFQLSYTFGGQDNLEPFLREKEQRLSLTLLFSTL